MGAQKLGEATEDTLIAAGAPADAATGGSGFFMGGSCTARLGPSVCMGRPVFNRMVLWATTVGEFSLEPKRAAVLKRDGDGELRCY